MGAQMFIDTLFGGPDAVMKHGPEDAVSRVLKGRNSTHSNTAMPIKVEIIQKVSSSKFNANVHEVDDSDIENHPMWTRRLMQYLVGPTLGVGGTAKVKIAYDPKTRKKVALKIVKP